MSTFKVEEELPIDSFAFFELYLDFSIIPDKQLSMKNIVLMLTGGILLTFFAFRSTLSNNENQELMEIKKEVKAKNVLGTELQSCCFEPVTGWYRDGYCNTDMRDRGVHVVCAILTDDFLNYSSSCGNNLTSPNPQSGFPGLKAGDKWCLCVSRWKEAMVAGVAPPIVLESTHSKALETVSLEDLKKHEVK